MRNDEVLYSIQGLEAPCPLLERVRQEYFAETEILSPAQRRWYANRDASVGANLTFAYFEVGRQLPKQIGWPAVRRAYQCLTTPTQTRRTDPICHGVLEFGHPLNMRGQAVLNGYLASGLSYEQIVARLGWSVAFVRLYANLYFDFPERRESSEFVAGVLDPLGERGWLQPDLADLLRIENPALRLTNIGFHYGPEVLNAVIGRAFDGHSLPSEAESLKNVNQWLLARAQRKAMAGQLTLEDPEFSLVKTLNQHQSQHSNSHKPTPQLEALSISAGAQETLNAILQDQIGSQLQALTGDSNTQQTDYEI